MIAQLKLLALSVLAVFAPVKAVLIATLALVIFDFITGVIAAWKRGEAITSQGFKRSVMKAWLYQAAIVLAYIAEHFLIGDLFPATKLISALIGLTELKSILENLDSISGDSFFKSIISKVGQATTANQLGDKDEK